MSARTDSDRALAAAARDWARARDVAFLRASRAIDEKAGLPAPDPVSAVRAFTEAWDRFFQMLAGALLTVVADDDTKTRAEVDGYQL